MRRCPWIRFFSCWFALSNVCFLRSARLQSLLTGCLSFRLSRISRLLNSAWSKSFPNTLNFWARMLAGLCCQFTFSSFGPFFRIRCPKVCSVFFLWNLFQRKILFLYDCLSCLLGGKYQKVNHWRKPSYLWEAHGFMRMWTSRSFRYILGTWNAGRQNFLEALNWKWCFWWKIIIRTWNWWFRFLFVGFLPKTPRFGLEGEVFYSTSVWSESFFFYGVNFRGIGYFFRR